MSVDTSGRPEISTISSGEAKLLEMLLRRKNVEIRKLKEGNLRFSNSN